MAGSALVHARPRQNTTLAKADAEHLEAAGRGSKRSLHGTGRRKARAARSADAAPSTRPCRVRIVEAPRFPSSSTNIPARPPVTEPPFHEPGEEQAPIAVRSLPRQGPAAPGSRPPDLPASRSLQPTWSGSPRGSSMFACTAASANPLADLIKRDRSASRLRRCGHRRRRLRPDRQDDSDQGSDAGRRSIGGTAVRHGFPRPTPRTTRGSLAATARGGEHDRRASAGAPGPEVKPPTCAPRLGGRVTSAHGRGGAAQSSAVQPGASHSTISNRLPGGDITAPDA